MACFQSCAERLHPAVMLRRASLISFVAILNGQVYTMEELAANPEVAVQPVWHLRQ